MVHNRLGGDDNLSRSVAAVRGDSASLWSACEEHYRKEWFSSFLAFIFGIVGTAGLILLSIFDTLRHPSLHRIFLVLFM
jgi:hypothetical protein